MLITSLIGYWYIVFVYYNICGSTFKHARHAMCTDDCTAKPTFKHLDMLCALIIALQSIVS
jgi:hypothetical protein